MANSGPLERKPCDIDSFVKLSGKTRQMVKTLIGIGVGKLDEDVFRANSSDIPAKQRRQTSAREHELIKKDLAFEADPAVLLREATGREHGDEACQVARADAGASGAVV
jgi:hypothetical protein